MEVLRMPEDKTLRLGKFGAGILAFVLWIVTGALGLVEIWIARQMTLRVYARFFAEEAALGDVYWGSIALGNWLVFILAIVWIALVIGGGEYHVKYVGKPKSWRLFARTIAVQLSILVLALFI
jgi:hypothetical protein